jgi:hypothetical protein
MLITLQTGQDRCYDSQGREIPCPGSGQDGEFRSGLAWPAPRFLLHEQIVEDRLTGLFWTRDANPGGYPLTWTEALAAVAAMNQRRDLGFDDWRLPNRRELRSLMSHQTRRPPLPSGHPFLNVFQGWYWSSTSAAINPAYAWYVHLEGARMFYGRKDQYYLFWPMRGESQVLPRTGQRGCYDAAGQGIDCGGSGQDGELQLGLPWPEPRFISRGEVVEDRLTGLIWMKNSDPAGQALDWSGALAQVDAVNRARPGGLTGWRLPDINMLESLVDCSRAEPALPVGHPFTNLREGYWSATTSYFEPDWAWVLYLQKGAIGVGHKPGATFRAWPVMAGLGQRGA